MIKTAGRLSVDGKDLKAIGDFLRELGTAASAIKSEAAKADEATALLGVRYNSLGGDLIKPVPDMRVAYLKTAQQLDADLGNLAKALEHTATAMAKIAKQYRDADQRNKLDAETVQKFLQGRGRG
jgi:hypothetical protein